MKHYPESALAPLAAACLALLIVTLVSCDTVLVPEPTLGPGETATPAIALPSPATPTPTFTVPPAPKPVLTDTVPTRTPLPTFTQVPTETLVQITPAPGVTQPELLEPPCGGGPYRNPITFSWKGMLAAGQTYQVVVRNVQLNYVAARSGVLTTGSWTAEVQPDGALATGEYNWQVFVVSSDGRILAGSARCSFWYSPNGAPQTSATAAPTSTATTTWGGQGGTIPRKTPTATVCAIEVYHCNCSRDPGGGQICGICVRDTCGFITPVGTQAWMATFVPVTPVLPTPTLTAIPAPTETPRPTAVIYSPELTSTPCSRLGAYLCNCTWSRPVQGASTPTCDLCVVCAESPTPVR